MTGVQTCALPISIRHDGILDSFGLTRSQIEDLILAARVKAGWIDEADLAPPPEEEESAGEETEETDDAQASTDITTAP